MGRKNSNNGGEGPYTPMHAGPTGEAVGYDVGEGDEGGASFVQSEDEVDTEEMEYPDEVKDGATDVPAVETQVETPLYLEAKATGGIIVDIYPEDIDADPTFNGRLKAVKVSDKDVKEFASDIELRGQLQPVRGFFALSGQVRLAFGFRRHAAFMLLNSTRKPKDKLKVSVFLDPAMSEAQAFLANLAENMQRRAINAGDVANNVMRLSEPPYNMTGVQIGKELHLSGPSISLYKKLAGVMAEQPRIVKLMEDGIVSRRQALDIAGLEKPEQRLAAIDAIAPEGAPSSRPAATKKAVKKAIKEAKGDKTGDKVTVKGLLAICDEEGTTANKYAGKVLEVLGGFLKGEFKTRALITRLNAL